MKLLTCSLLLALVLTTAKTNAQNEYLLMEFVKMKPGITDTASVMNYIRNRVDVQEQKFKAVIRSTVWQPVNPARNKNQYDYVIVTSFKNFTDWLSEYKNVDSKGVYYSLTKGRLDSTSMRKNDSFDIIYTPIYEMFAETDMTSAPGLMLVKYVKATPGKEISYENLQTGDWLTIHKDLIKKNFEAGYNFCRLIFPEAGGDFNYTNFIYFKDDAMFEKQNDIDYDPYMRANQSAFINAGNLNKEIFSEMFSLVAVVKQ
ncbi:hypothetical protein I5907_11320 [Panacibacter sp. DH6]|uniref:GLPGLI family protein n=1 Tax=Panacibacter microcysteis TaxID=2793269 RepID=A0A931E3B4_9BACT|nr:hypothetical protein [Panacibacter microcysteis]MBG9376830.1 hypothetical protein [Panacibacter microcysteis]